MTRSIILIAHNLRSCHNVGSLLRTADGLGVKKVYLTGYTPYPVMQHDERLPHIAAKMQRQIDKTALGADKNLPWEHITDVNDAVFALRRHGYMIVALEQSVTSVNLASWPVHDKTALVVGRETKGIETDVLQLCDEIVEITMLGRKESFNVVQAAAMALYHCTYYKL